MEGWIKLHRKLLDSTIFTSGDAHLLQLFIYLLLSVNHEDRKVLINNQEVIIKKGQGIFGIKTIVFALTKCKKEKSKLFSKSESLYYRKLKTLANINIIEIKSTNKYSIVTINNWESYQSNEDQLKIKRRSDEDQMKTNKKDKNVKNILSKDNMAIADAETAQKKGNPEIDLILEQYKNHIGFSPTDKHPRRVAQNLRQVIHTLMKDLAVLGKDIAFEDIVVKTMKWYVKEHELKGDTLDVVKRKSRKLFDATREKYTKGGENA